MNNFILFNGQKPALTSQNFNNEMRKSYQVDKSFDQFNSWAKRSTTTGNTRNNIKNKTQELRNPKSPPLTGLKGFGQK